MKSNTLPIVFHTGTYGTYLEWCLTSLTSTAQIVSPFTSIGTSHLFKGNHLVDIDGWRTYLKSNQVEKFVRFHPKVNQEQNLDNILFEVNENVEHAIYLQPDSSTLLLCLNNFCTKGIDNWLEYQLTNIVSLDQIYQGWPECSGMSIKDIPRWIIREFLSLYLMPKYLDLVKSNNSHALSNIVSITVGKLLFDFEHTIEYIGNHCDINFLRPVSDLFEFHSKNLSLQPALTHQEIVDNVINAVTNNNLYDWSETPLSLVTESYLQWQLRNLGWEIECNNLDEFPTNSIKLTNIIYPL